jgi:DNA-binding response OmpR family regulator
MAAQLLIIDDDADFRKAIRIVLQKNGFICEEAVSAKNGFEKLKTNKPDMIILDAMLEDLASGFRFADTVKKSGEYSSIPILMVTAIDKVTKLNFIERKGTRLLPVDGYIEKPIEPETLIALIRQMLGN